METKNAESYGIDWTNIDLNNEYQSDQDMLDGYNFKTLLLEVECNLPEITEETVRKQALDSLESKITSMKEILENNLANITRHAQKERNAK